MEAACSERALMAFPGFSESAADAPAEVRRERISRRKKNFHQENR
jgi:hypothetical protein